MSARRSVRYYVALLAAALLIVAAGYAADDGGSGARRGLAHRDRSATGDIDNLRGGSGIDFVLSSLDDDTHETVDGNEDGAAQCITDVGAAAADGRANCPP